MNKNKLVFFIISGVLIFLIIFFIFLSSGSNKQNISNTKKGPNDFTIWTSFPDMKNSLDLVAEFKKAYPKYASKNIKIENFSDYETYSYALQSSFSSGVGPDVFVLNNNETSIFANMTIGLSENIISIGDFRKSYKSIFANDLIIQAENTGEFLIGIPVGYENLGIFYNKRYVRGFDLKTISSLNSIISKLKQKNNSSIPLAIGNGTTVKFSSDIATQFMILDDGGTSIEKLTSSQVQTGLGAYLNYGYKDSNNNFNSKYAYLKDKNEKSSYLFTNNDSFMIVGYPRLINDIDKIGGFPVNFLFAEPFPHYVPGEGKTLVNYNYFVLNKNTKNKSTGEAFLQFLASEKGQTIFFKSYPFYLPAYLRLETEIKNTKIHNNYNVKIGDFYNDSYELTSFNKGIKNIYDRELPIILDLGENYSNSFTNFSRKLNCMTKKVLNFINIGSSCE